MLLFSRRQHQRATIGLYADKIEVTTTMASITSDTFMETPASTPPPKYDIPPYFLGGDTAPCPGFTYIIRVKDTDRAMTLTNDGLRLEDTAKGQNENNRWLCVDDGMYIGFYNIKAKVFMGHDNKGIMVAMYPKLKPWEWMGYRKDRKGGYQLLSARWSVHKKFVNAIEDCTRVARENNLHTLWEFEEVREDA